MPSNYSFRTLFICLCCHFQLHNYADQRFLYPCLISRNIRSFASTKYAAYFKGVHIVTFSSQTYAFMRSIVPTKVGPAFRYPPWKRSAHDTGKAYFGNGLFNIMESWIRKMFWKSLVCICCTPHLHAPNSHPFVFVHCSF